jgi:hypothetical protein
MIFETAKSKLLNRLSFLESIIRIYELSIEKLEKALEDQKVFNQEIVKYLDIEISSPKFIKKRKDIV